MAPRKRPRAPRILLIFCEGKTEEEYFNILLDFYRPPAYVEVAIYGQKGQHISLIDKAAAHRDELLHDDTELSEADIECWAVCDEDQMPCSYTDLLAYADQQDVHLAFSAPQFEMYLLQHFEQSGESDRAAVFHKLSSYRKKYGSVGEYDNDTKADLSWMYEAIDRQPKIVKMAIVNSNLRNRTTKRPFLTVQELTERIVDISI